MTRSSFYKRAILTVSLLVVLLVFAAWRDATVGTDFDLVTFTVGLIYGGLVVTMWMAPLMDGVNAFLEWLDR
jgi:hypothetical protein